MDPYYIRRFEVVRYTRTVAHRIDPRDYRCTQLAAELADLYAPIHSELRGSAESLVVAIRAFLRWLSTEPDPLPLSLVEVTADHLQGWERSLSKLQREFPSHGPYDKFVNFRALLLRISQDAPDRIHPTLHALLTSAIVTVLPEMRPVEGLPPFSALEQRRIIRAAYLDVAGGLRLASDGHTERLRPRMRAVLTALHVLLSIGTGEPPEVLRNIRLGDIRPLEPGSEMMGPDVGQRAPWLKQTVLSKPNGYCVQLRKLRAHTLYDTFVTRRDRHSCFALEASILVTAPFRTQASSDALWIGQDGRHAVFSNRNGLSRWFAGHGIRPDGSAAFARFRKAVVGAEAMADPAAYLAMARRHRAPTFFRSYVNNPVLRSHSGRILMGAIGSAFEKAIQPTVITPAQMDLIERDAAPADLRLGTIEQRALLSGEMEGPHAACRDPLNSPFDRPGDTCGSSASGLCFVCPNAIITERHLPALVFFAHRLHPDRAGDIEAWKRAWEPVWTAITQGILPRFSETLIDQAQSRLDSVYVDIGVRQDLAALEVEP